MGRQRLLLLILLIGVFLVAGAWRIYDAVHTSQNSYLTGTPPKDIMTSLLPAEVDPALVRAPAIMSDDPMRFGGATSVLSIIQFGDYQCEACRLFSQTAKETLRAYGGNIRYVWRDMPLVEIHGRAMDAAIFARCAGQQGKFWETHDNLIDTGDLDESSLQAIMRTVGLDPNRMRTCRADPAVRTAIEKDVEFAKSEGIQSVPFIFVGTKGSIGAMTADELRAAIGQFAE